MHLRGSASGRGPRSDRDAHAIADLNSIAKLGARLNAGAAIAASGLKKRFSDVVNVRLYIWLALPDSPYLTRLRLHVQGVSHA